MMITIINYFTEAFENYMRFFDFISEIEITVNGINYGFNKEVVMTIALIVLGMAIATVLCCAISVIRNFVNETKRNRINKKLEKTLLKKRTEIEKAYNN